VGQLSWTIVTLCIVVGQMKFVAHNIFEGLFWFFFPALARATPSRRRGEIAAMPRCLRVVSSRATAATIRSAPGRGGGDARSTPGPRWRLDRLWGRGGDSSAPGSRRRRPFESVARSRFDWLRGRDDDSFDSYAAAVIVGNGGPRQQREGDPRTIRPRVTRSGS